MSRQQPPAQRGGKYPPGKAIYQDPAANMEESDSDEEIEDEVEFDLLEAMGDMTKNQRRRVYALKGLLAEYRQIKKQYEDEIAALAVKQLAEDREGYEERRKIISGERDVTEEEAKALTEAATKESGVEEVPSSDDEADAKKKGGADAKEKKSVKVVTPADQSGKSDLEKAGESATGGIPAFWLTAMKNNEVLEGMISERDEAALKYLTHVDTSFIDDSFKKGFTLVFHFAPNEFFTNETLTKRYLMVQEDGEDNSGDDDQTLDKIEGCDIDWKSVEKKLTVVIKQKKQRHKSGKGVRVVQREEKCPSFFHFFTAPVEPEDEEEEDEEELPYEDQLEMDYEAGLAFRQSLIPRAAHYYSGRSIDEIAAGFDYPTDDDEEEEEEEESEEEEVVPQRGGRGGGARGGARGGAPAQAPGKSGGKQPDCKQQ